MTFKTEQENFWASEFGDKYISRNNDEELHLGNLNMFSKVFVKVKNVKTVLEFGANIGLNLKAINQILPDCELSGIEINKKAANILSKQNFKVYEESILDFHVDYKRDFSFIKTVLIHINPNELQNVYQKLYDSSNKYILIAEYYNPTPVTISYRGHTNKLFKRDFAGEMLDKFTDLKLVDYGFAYHRDKTCYQDDVTWFLMEKP